MKDLSGSSGILLAAVLGSTLLVASVYDLRYGKIPNWLNYSAMAVGIILSVHQKSLTGLLLSLSGIAVGIALLLVPYMAGGMGAGDVKLLGAVGSFTGPKGVFIAFLCTAFAGLVYAIFVLVRHGMLKKTISRYWTIFLLSFWGGKVQYVTPTTGEVRVPPLRYAVAITVGTAVSFVLTKAGYIAA